MQKTKQSVAEIITEQVIKSLNDGVVPWTLSMTKPYNAKSSREYTGLNRFLLAHPAKIFNDQRFLTFNEIQALGGQILNDEQGHIVFFATSDNTSKEADSLHKQCISCKYGEKCRFSEEKTIWQTEQALLGDQAEICSDFLEKRKYISRYYKLWNIQQTTLKDSDLFQNALQPTSESRLKADDFLDAMEKTRLRIKNVPENSGYDTDSDSICVLSQSAFSDINKYYAHIFRLMALACGHEKRLNLPYLREASNLYDYGTIVSEMVVAIMCGECGIEINYKRSADYIAGLIRVLKKDPKFVIMAGRSSNRVVKYLQDLHNLASVQAA